MWVEFVRESPIAHGVDVQKSGIQSVVMSFVAAFRLPDMAHLGALKVTGLLTCALLQGLRTPWLERN
jgi:hypothetical protein